MSERCLFCAIAAGRVPAHVVYEDDRVVAFLDIHPSAPGHTLIIPRAHVTRIEDLSPEDASALFTALHRLTKPIREAVEAEAATVGINDGPGSGQEVPHVHIHVIPRQRGDGGTLIQLVARTGTRGTSLADVADKIRKKIAQPTNG